MKLKIDNESIAEEFFENSFLMGIVAPIKDYTFIWNVNNKLRFRFRINNNLEIQLKKKSRNYFFSVYEFYELHSGNVHYLYNNQNDGEYLLPEFKHLDFLWLIKGGDDEPPDKADSGLLLQGIRLLPSVQLVNEMTNEKIKHKQHLIL
jgi:hypothetical protein